MWRSVPQVNFQTLAKAHYPLTQSGASQWTRPLLGHAALVMFYILAETQPGFFHNLCWGIFVSEAVVCIHVPSGAKHMQDLFQQIIPLMGSSSG